MPKTDISVRELGTGKSRVEVAKTLGITFDVGANLPIDDGIECVKSALSRIWIDQNRCKRLIKALENY